MNTRLVLSFAGLAGAAVLFTQIHVGAAPEVKAVEDDGTGQLVTGGCTPNSGPDVIVGDILPLQKWGTIGNITAYSIGTTSCNIGNANLLWQACNPNHPVIAQNIYRFKDGRFEQIGMGWLKHGFVALTQNLCCTCSGQGGSVLGVGCSDPYVASLNGDQNGNVGGCGCTSGGLGPRWQVNATTGAYAFPYATCGQSGNTLFKRVQVNNDDVNPSLNTGAVYYAEGQYVTPDDAAAENLYNNASYRRLNVGSFQNGGWLLNVTGSTTRELPAIFAWKDNDAGVTIVSVDVPEVGTDNKGKYHLGYRVTDNGDGTWHYEYALFNMNSHRSAREFTIGVPSGVTLTNVGFHDIDYHSGDGQGGITNDGTDWAVTTGAGDITWSTETEAENANANALRWGTLYNFRFDADTAPTNSVAIVGLYRTSSPLSETAPVLGPSAPPPCPWDCDGSADGVVAVADLLALLAQYDPESPLNCTGGACDFDGSGCVDVADLLKLLAHYDPQGVGCPQ